MTVPSPEEQLKFLGNIQRLLSEGQFSATYKFALLNALADICVEAGPRGGEQFSIPTDAIAEKFLAYYWRQNRPYALGGEGRGVVLRQNSGQAPTIFRLIDNLLREGFANVGQLRHDAKKWRRAVARADGIIRTMPLWKLQTVGREELVFLYDNEPGAYTITLKPGAAFCLRRFHPLIVELARGAWTRFVRRLNAPALGPATDLEEFLFGGERAGLGVYVPLLTDLQADRCFYCGATLGEAREVDHFIPWARYQSDFAENFVLVDPRCNRHKSDNVACAEHLSRWAERNRAHGTELIRTAAQARAQVDPHAWLGIARWIYSAVAESGALTWANGTHLVPLARDWESALAA